MHKYRAYTSNSMSFNNALPLIWFNTFCSFECFEIFSEWAIDTSAKGIKQSRGVINGFNSIIVKAKYGFPTLLLLVSANTWISLATVFFPKYARMCESGCPHLIFIWISLGARLKVVAIQCNFSHSMQKMWQKYIRLS